ncbi:MAG: inorganic diphosphatase [Candidatus Avispirillum sp.]
MCHFFTVYKQLEEKDTAVDGLDGPEEAKKIIAKAIDSYERLYGGKKAD